MTAVKSRSMSEILAPAPESEAQVISAAEAAPAASTEPAKAELPKKYEGKTVAEVADMHMNAESELGRVRNENHTYRGLVSDLTALRRETPEPVIEVAEPLDVSGEELITDPVGTVRKIVERDIAQIRTEVTQDNTASQVLLEDQALTRDYGDIPAIVGSPEFQEFALRTPGRKADFNTAARGEGLDQVRAARRLLEDFTDFQTVTKTPEEKAELTPLEIAKQVSTEGAGPAGSITTQPSIYEADVIKMVNDDPVKYRSPSFQNDLALAIKEGRFVKL